MKGGTSDKAMPRHSKDPLGAFLGVSSGKKTIEVEDEREKDLPVLVSACLLGLRCRFDGQEGTPSQEVLELARRGKAIPICPEELGGLPTPRPPAEISNGTGIDVINGRARVVDVEGRDVTPNFLRGAEECAKLARLFGARLAILKDKSPSCGSRLIHDGSFTGRLKEGEGVTAALLKREGVKVRTPS